jgi:hypothetical protein
MTPFPEQEPMAIRRIEVALKKRDWILFKQGILKINSMHETGTLWSDVEGWQGLINQAESENIPPDLMEEFSLITKGIIESIDENTMIAAYTESENTQENIQEDIYPSENKIASEDKVAIFFNQDIDTNQSSAIKKHKITLNNIINNFLNYAPEPKWLEELSKLLHSFDKPNNDITSLVSILSFYKQSGTIITTSCDNNIVKALLNENIDFSIPDIKQLHGSDNYWELLPLGGLCCSYICSECGSRSVKTELHTTTVVGSCSKCAGAIYPDITDICDDTAEVNPKIWWKAFKKLSDASTWILVNPPAFNEKALVKDLIKDAASDAKKVYIITQNFEISEWWSKGLSKLMPEAEIMSNFSCLSSLAGKLNETYQRVGCS